ncbi:MAG: hypothetical protein ABSG63_13360, partial [Spirochaetia bacterium]
MMVNPSGGDRLAVETDIDGHYGALREGEAKPDAPAEVKPVESETLVLVAHLARVQEEVTADDRWSASTKGSIGGAAAPDGAAGRRRPHCPAAREGLRLRVARKEPA